MLIRNNRDRVIPLMETRDSKCIESRLASVNSNLPKRIEDDIKAAHEAIQSEIS
jgi:hypothetical protein